MKKLLSIFGVGFFAAILALYPIPSGAVALTVDQIIYEPSAGLDPANLSASVDASVNGSTLTIVLRNTSLLTGGMSSGWLLSGLGFELPDGVVLTNTGAYITAGSTGWYKINGTHYSLLAGANLRGEWGGGPPDGSGPFANVTTLEVDYVTGTLQSAVDDGSPFDPGAYLKNPVDVNGPEFGLLSTNFSDAGGLGYVKDSMTFTWNWTGSGLTEDFLENGNVVVSFGSSTAVPEPSTLLLLGSGLLALGGWGRYRNRM